MDVVPPRLRILSLVTCLFPVPFASATIILDDFSVHPLTITANTPDANLSDTRTDLDPAHVFRSRRTVTLQGDLASGSLDAVVDTSGPGSVSYTSHSPKFNPSFLTNTYYNGRLILTYLGTDRFQPFDLTTLPEDTFAIDIFRANSGTPGTPLAGHINLLGGRVDFPVPSSLTPYTIYVPFSALAAAGSNLTHAINLGFDFDFIPPAGSLAIDSIRIVPEPTTVALAAVAATLLPSLRRRARRA